MRMTAGAAALLLLALTAVAAQAKDADPIAVGRYHLRKANQLAGEDHCHSAIHEYTLAYDKLRDPVVLFNRAECYRRIGQAEKAVSDYRAFLEAVPAAPNRADIEAKVAALSRSRAPAATAAAAPANTAAPPPPRPAARPVAAAPPPVPTAPPATAPPPTPVPEAAPPVAAPSVVSLEPPPATPPGEAEAHAGHTWLWIAIGAVVVGGAAGAYVALRSPTTTPPPTDLGNYKF